VVGEKMTRKALENKDNHDPMGAAYIPLDTAFDNYTCSRCESLKNEGIHSDITQIRMGSVFINHYGDHECSVCNKYWSGCPNCHQSDDINYDDGKWIETSHHYEDRYGDKYIIWECLCCCYKGFKIGPNWYRLGVDPYNLPEGVKLEANS
jgi:hypothetical protein